MTKKRKRFIAFLAAADVVLLFYYLAERVNSYNATLLAFSYQYGFIPRGFVGTVYQLLDRLLPADLRTYGAVNGFVLITTVGYAVLLFIFLYFILQRIGAAARTAGGAETEEKVYPLAGYYNFGRVDMYLVLLSMLSVALLIREKGIGLLVLLAPLCVMIHEGYVFMYLNILLVLLLYKALSYMEAGEERRARRYLLLLALIVGAASVLFLYFMFFRHKGTQEIYEQIVQTANAMSYRHKCHKDVVRAEILRMDLSEKERGYHIQNFIEFPIFLILMAPFLGIAVKFFRKIFAAAQKGSLARIKYAAVAAGAVTTLPLFLWKVDYGRWCFAVIAYYCLVLLALMAMGDRIVLSAWRETIEETEHKWACAPFLLAYALLLTPLCDVAICKFSYLIYSFPEKIGKMLG